MFTLSGQYVTNSVDWLFTVGACIWRTSQILWSYLIHDCMFSNEKKGLKRSIMADSAIFLTLEEQGS